MSHDLDYLSSEQILSGVAVAVKELIHNENLMEAITVSLTILGKATQAAGVRLFLNHEEGTGTTRNDSQVIVDMTFSKIQPLIQMMMDGCTYRLISWNQMKGIGEELHLAPNIKSSLLIPIFVRDQFWGFLDFDDTNQDGSWSEAVCIALSCFADSIKKSIEWDLLKRELHRSTRLAVEANETKSKFLSHMSHEIRTPMNAILGYSTLLEDLVEGNQGKSYLRGVQKAGNMLLSQINDILDLTKIEAGLLVLQSDFVSLRKLFSEIREMFQIKLQQEPVILEVSVSDEVPELVIQDETRIRQILANLIGNAIKFTEKGSIQVTASVEPDLICTERPDPLRLILEVKDTGIGIPEAQLPSIFEPFIQSAGQDARKYGGTGLGLAITSRLVREMGGEITVESKAGKGTVFLIKIPVRSHSNNIDGPLIEIQRTNRGIQGNQANLAAPESPGWESFETQLRIISARQPVETSVTQPKILVVDAVLDNLLIAETVLSGDNYTVTIAQSGRTAISLLEKENYDLILMDVVMQDLNGFETCELIKNMEGRADIPIIFLTAKADIESITRAFEVGGADYIRKPYNHRELLARIKTHLELRRSREQLELLSTTDPVTKLSNLRDIVSKIQYEQVRFQRKGDPFSLVAIELQGYERLNNEFGTEFRDLVLQTIADQMKSHVRRMDFPARQGQGNFLLLLPDTGAYQAEIVIEKLKFILNGRMVVMEQDEFPIVIVAGAATYEAPIEAESLIQAAERALIRERQKRA